MEFVRPLEPILIIDEGENVREDLNNILSELGYDQVYLMPDFESAKEVMQTQRPSVVFLDIELPDSDGMELAYLNEKHPESKIIMCSGHNSMEAVQLLWEGGAHEYIDKPFNTKKVDTVLKRLELN